MSNVTFDFSGKVVLVTGAKGGLGKAYALAFARAGADLAICDLKKEGDLEGVACEVKAMGCRVVAMKVDVANKGEVQTMVDKTISELGKIDVLLNNAGVSPRGSIFETTEEVWDRTIDTNLKGCYLFCQAAGKNMVERKQGSIINVASELAFRVDINRVAYIASKFGILGLTRVLARELRQYNIRVNVLAPGLVKTPMTEYIFRKPEAATEFIPGLPLGRIGETDDLIYAAMFLASDGAKWMSGQTMVVDGGTTA